MSGSRGDISHFLRCGDYPQRLSVKTALCHDYGVGTMTIPHALIIPNLGSVGCVGVAPIIIRDGAQGPREKKNALLWIAMMMQ